MAGEDEKINLSNVGVVAIILLAIAGGHYMTMIALDAKLSVLEQKIGDTGGMVQSQVTAVENKVVQAANAATATSKAAAEVTKAAGADKPAPAKVEEAAEPAEEEKAAE